MINCTAYTNYIPQPPIHAITRLQMSWQWCWYPPAADLRPDVCCGSGGWWWWCSSLRIVMEILGADCLEQRPPPCGLKIQQQVNSNNGTQLRYQMSSSGHTLAIVYYLSSSLVWSGGGVCQGMCGGDVLSNYKPRAGQVTIHQAVSALCCHDDQLMIPVSSTLSSAPHLTLQWLVVSGAMEKIV